MPLTRRASFAVAAAILLTLAACSPVPNRNAAGNDNSPKPASNSNGASATAANTNAAPKPKSKPGTGVIEITSVPTGAGITLMATGEDSAGTPQAYGPTPATLNDLAPGKYTVTLHQNGYKEFRREVEVKADAVVQVNATLKR